MTVKAVILDAFGTILSSHAAAQPYRLLFREGLRQGRRPTPDDDRVVMTLDCGIEGAAQHLGIHLSQTRLREIEEVLEADLDSIKPFPDAIAGIELLRDHGVAIAVCSNLAQPYGAVVSRLFPHLDAYGYSFQSGVLKPEPRMYRWVCEQLGVRPEEDAEYQGAVHMIGDSIRCDRDGPRAVGIIGHHLDRRGGGEISDLLQFVRLVVSGRC